MRRNALEGKSKSSKIIQVDPEGIKEKRSEKW
jgi:hypothetical protein